MPKFGLNSAPGRSWGAARRGGQVSSGVGTGGPAEPPTLQGPRGRDKPGAPRSVPRAGTDVCHVPASRRAGDGQCRE